MNLLLFSRGCQLAWVFALVYSQPVAIPLHFSIPLGGGGGGVTVPLHTRPRPSDLGIGKAGLWQQVSFQRRSCCTAAGRVPLREASPGETGVSLQDGRWGLPAKKREEGPRAPDIKGQAFHGVFG